MRQLVLTGLIVASLLACGGGGGGPAVPTNPGGSLDATFGTGGVVTTTIGGSDDRAYGVVVQADGKIVAGGTADVGGATRFALARYHIDGSLDTSFGSGGKVPISIGSELDFCLTLALQPDGKTVAGGYSYAGSGTARFALVRCNADGSLDNSFGTGGKVTTAIGTKMDGIMALAVQPDGKILAAGYTANGSGVSEYALARYDPAGSLDPGFGNAGVVTTAFQGLGDTAQALTIQADGRILAGGYSKVAIGDTRFSLARYQPNGSLDPTFGTGGKVTTAVGPSYAKIWGLGVQSGGRIVAGGLARMGTRQGFALCRYATDGTLDSAFGSAGLVTTPLGSGRRQDRPDRQHHGRQHGEHGPGPVSSGRRPGSGLRHRRDRRHRAWGGQSVRKRDRAPSRRTHRGGFDHRQQHDPGDGGAALLALNPPGEIKGMKAD